MGPRAAFLRLGLAATVACLAALPLAAQVPTTDESCGCDLDCSEQAYEIGRFDLVLELVGCLPQLDRRDREDARLLLAKAYLALDEFESADEMVSKVLDDNPVYQTTRTDPKSLERLVAGIRARGATVVVSSVSKTAEGLREAPATVIVVTAEEIVRRGYLDLEAVLHDLPGFDISRGNGILYSNVYQRGYRSDGTDRTLLLVDGVEENDLWSNAAWISRQYPLSNVERIEVVYGPASTMYGPNAFLGVINVITRDPVDLVPEGKRLSYDFQVGGGPWNTTFVDGTVAGRLGSNVAFSLTGRVYESDEMDLTPFGGPRRGLADRNAYWDYDPEFYDLLTYGGLSEPETARMYDKAALDSLTGGPLAFSDRTDDWSVSGKLQLSRNFIAGFQAWQREEGFNSWFTDELFAGGEDGTLWIPNQVFFYAKYDQDLVPGKLGLSIFSRFKRHRLAEGTGEQQLRSYGNFALGEADLANGVPSHFQQALYRQSSRQFRNEITVSWRPSSVFSLVGGLEVRNSQIQGDYNLRFRRPEGVEFTNKLAQEYFCDTATQGVVNVAENCSAGQSFDQVDLGLFAQGTYRLAERWKVVLGGRLDHNEVSQIGRDVLDENGAPLPVEGYGLVFNPRAALIYSREKHVVKAVYSEAFKDASNFNRYATSPSTRELQAPDLQSEEVRNLELSASWQPRVGLDLDASVYRAEYSNAVTLQRNFLGPATTGRNVNRGSRTITGLQAAARWRSGKWEGFANYTFNDPQEDSEGGSRRIGDVSSHRLNAGVNYALAERWNFNLRSNWVGDRKTGAGTTVDANPLAQVDSYLVLNGALTYRHPRSPIHVQLVATNLFDERYFHAGVRSADGAFFAAQLPQNERAVFLRVGFTPRTGGGPRQ